MNPSPPNPNPIEEAINLVHQKFEMTPKVAIAGFGNAGKSSLFNAIYGQQLAAVSMRTDQTQDAQTANRFGIDFTDTPGIGTAKFSLEKVAQMGVLDRQHIVIHTLNGAAAISAEDEQLHELIEKSRAKRVTVVNKVDLLDPTEQAQFAESLGDKLGLFEGDFLYVSAKKMFQIDTLVRRITELLPEAMQDGFIAQQRADGRLKERRIRTLIYSKAAACAGVALTPIAVADIFLITPIQLALVTAIGYYHGITVTRERALELLGVLGAGLGLREAARQLIKLVPGAGSVVSAAIAFAGTVALGEAANFWLKQQMRVSNEELRRVFSSAAESARAEYDQHRQAAEAAAAEVAELRRRHQAGQLSDEQFSALLAATLDPFPPAE